MYLESLTWSLWSIQDLMRFHKLLMISLLMMKWQKFNAYRWKSANFSKLKKIFQTHRSVLYIKIRSSLTRRRRWCPFWTNELVRSSELIKSKFEKWAASVISLLKFKLKIKVIGQVFISSELPNRGDLVEKWSKSFKSVF